MNSLHNLSRDNPGEGESPLAAGTIALITIAAGVTIFLLQYMQTLFAPMAFCLLLFCALDPLVDRLERLHIPRFIGAAFALVLVVVIIAGGLYSLQDEALTVINRAPVGARKIAALLERGPKAAPGALDKMEQAADTLQKTSDAKPKPGVVRVQVEEPRMSATNLLWSGSMGAFSALNQFVMILFLTYFILLSDKTFRRKFVELAPTLAQKKLTLEMIDVIGSQIGRFLMVQLFTSAVVGVVTWAVLSAIGLEQAPLWGLLAGVFNSVPYYGPIIVSAGLAAVSFLQFGAVGPTIAIASAALLITSLEGWLLTPMLMGKVAEMNRVAVFVGLLFWSWAWGIWGLLLAVPMMMSIKVFCDHVDDLKPVGRFLGE
jgi:predicted PurR-regulated permease PerM